MLSTPQLRTGGFYWQAHGKIYGVGGAKTLKAVRYWSTGSGYPLFVEVRSEEGAVPWNKSWRDIAPSRSKLEGHLPMLLPCFPRLCLLEESFTAHMPFLMALGAAFRLGRSVYSSPHTLCFVHRQWQFGVEVTTLSASKMLLCVGPT